MLEKIKLFANDFLEKTRNKEILLVSHFDADGITSAAILGKALKKLDKNFSIKIIKSLDSEFISQLPKNRVIVFTDLASSHLEELSKLETLVFIIDHHEIDLRYTMPWNLQVINPHLYADGEEMSGACLTYLVCRELVKKDSSLANLAIIGMVGDLMDKKVGPLVNTILKDADLTIKKGILLYPSTRPLNKALEYCSNPYIPGVTGDCTGACALLREAGIEFTAKGYKSLMELNEDEMQRLVTAIALKMPNHEKMSEFIGNLFLIKFFNRLEDAREMSALVNACSRMGESNVALLFCMGNENARKQAETVYIKYKQSLIEALNHVNTNPKIQGKQYMIINAKDKIQDTIIGTVASILSMSALYEEGTIIITMAYNQDKIKVSSRICGREKIDDSKNLKEIMDSITELIGGESGGHKLAAGCIIGKDKEEAFIDLVKKKLDIEVIKC
ncbi:DHH family phosphoesterase [Candidatus Pacearchaeota archaeon]|nr:DHH family phosphoesterase [Candidatus Pacearchaeota archaeon]